MAVVTAILTALAAKASTYLVGAAVIIAAFVATYVKGRLSGAKLERDKQAANQLDAIKKRKETDDEIASLGSADVDTRLDKWLRDK